VVVFVDPVSPCLSGEVTFTFTVVDEGAGVGLVSARFAGTALTLSDDGAGLYSATRDTDPLQENVHALEVTAIDTSNNVATVSRAFGVSRGAYVVGEDFTCGSPPDGGAPDTSPPTLTILAPAVGALVGDVVSVTVESDDESRPMTVTADVGDGPVALTGFTVWTGDVPTTTLPEGAGSVTVESTDALGQASSATRSFVVDHTQPTLTIVEPLAGETRVALTDVVVESTDENGVVRVVLYRQGVAEPLAIVVEPLPSNPARFGLFYQLPCAGLPDDVTFVVESHDAAGNVATASVTVTVTPEGCG